MDGIKCFAGQKDPTGPHTCFLSKLPFAYSLFSMQNTSVYKMVRVELHTESLWSVDATVPLAGSHWFGGSQVGFSAIGRKSFPEAGCPL